MGLSNKKSVLVTGAGGFIGLNIVKEFVDSGGFDVFAVVHRSMPEELIQTGATIIKTDVSDETVFSDTVKGTKFDIVIHAAGLASDIGKNEVFRKINFESVKYVSKCAKEKFIYISSTDVYGIKDFDNADESTPLFEYPKNPYPHYKILSEEWIRNNIKNYVIIRPGAVFGENDKTLEKRFTDFLKISPFIVHFGKHQGKNRWPLANVKNVAKTILACALFDDFNNEAINIIDEKITSIDGYYRELAEKYFPNRKFVSICLPLFVGKFIGYFSTLFSNLSGMKHPLYDPTYYAVHHVASNLDFSGEKMKKALELLK